MIVGADIGSREGAKARRRTREEKLAPIFFRTS
jgi:hypothetical protein